MNRKPIRLAVASLVAVLSVLGMTQAGAVSGAVTARGDNTWCC
jgi:hypothetical protein